MLQSTTFWVLALLAAVVLVWAVGIYNRLVSLRVRARNAWSDVDVQLKRRYDLVPNLVATVQGYASHEKAIFEDVARLRAEAMGTSGPADSDQPDARLAEGIKTLFAVAENYPDLRADQNFRKLQDQLADVENNIQYARRYYNAVVRDMNTSIEVVPNNLVASLFGFGRLEYFQAGESERGAVQVDLSAKGGQP